MAYTLSEVSESEITPKSPVAKEKYTLSAIEKEAPSSEQKNSKLKGAWDYYKENILRTGLQVPAGIAEKFSSALNVWELAGLAESLQDLEELEEKYPGQINREEYLSNLQKSLAGVPTQKKAEKFLEEKLGIPFEPKSKTQKALRLGSLAYGLKPGDFANKAIAGASAPALSETLQQLGAPEELANAAATLGSQYTGRIPLPSIQKGVKTPRIEAKAPNTEEALKGFTKAGEKFSSENELGNVLKTEAPNIAPEKINVPPNIKPPEAPKVPPNKPSETPQTETARQTQQIAGSIISRTRSPNSTAGGNELRDVINNQSEQLYEHTNQLYDRSKQLNSEEMNIRPDLSNRLERIIEELGNIPEPSSVQKDIIKTAEAVLSEIGTRETGYRPISNQALISQIQSINQKTKHDYVQGDPKNIYRPLVNALDEAVLATSANNPEAVEAFNAARSSYADWASRFKNDYIMPWRNPENRSVSALYNGIQSPDELAVLRDILEDTPEGNDIYNKARRSLIENKFSPYFTNPGKIDDLGYYKLMEEISPITTNQERVRLDRVIRAEAEAQNKNEERAKKHKEEVKEQEKHLSDFEKQKKDYEKSLLEYQKEAASQKATNPLEGKSPEQVSKMADSISGLEELEKIFNKTPKGRRLLKDIKEYKASQLISNGKLKPEEDVKNLVKLLNDKEKRAYLIKTLGPERVNELESIVKNIDQIQSFLKEVEKEIGENSADFKNVKNLSDLLIQAFKFAAYNPKTASKRFIIKLLKPENLKRLAKLGKSIPKKIKFKPHEAKGLVKKFRTLTTSLAKLTEEEED